MGAESRSAVVRGLLIEYRVFSSRLAPLEITSAVRRRAKSSGVYRKPSLQTSLRPYATISHNWELADLDRGVLRHAEESLRSASVRTLDALQISSASSAQATLGVALLFITADARQRDAARQVGLKVTWVE